MSLLPNPSDQSTSMRRRWLLSLLLSNAGRLDNRLGAFRQRLRALSRGQRRHLDRAAAGLLAGASGLALMALMAGPLAAPVAAAGTTIAVDNSTCTLIDAIKAANTNAVMNGCSAGSAAGADTIRLDADVTLTAFWNWYYDAYSGTPLITSDIILDGRNRTLSRTGTGYFRLLSVSTGGDLTVKDLTISSGDVTNLNYSDGGAIYSKGPLTLQNVTLSGNRAGDLGGAILTTGAITITDSTFSNNWTDSSGGGIFSYGDFISITNSIFSGNESEFYSGGAIFSQSDVFTITNSTFTNNLAKERGGAVINQYAESLTILQSTFVSNQVTSLYGGAVFVYDLRDVTISESTFTGNTAALDGGAISGSSASMTILASTFGQNSSQATSGAIGLLNTPLTVHLSSFLANTAGTYGGVMTFWGAQSALTVTNTTISGNTAADDGGVIKVYDGSPTFINGVVISSNQSDSDGGVIFTNGNVDIRNATFLSNTADANAGVIYTTGNLAIDHAYFANNVAGNSAGAIFSSGAVTVTADIGTTSFLANDSGSSAAVLYFKDGTLNIDDSVFQSNNSSAKAGALHLRSGDVTISNSIFDRNISENSGGELLIEDADVTMTASQATGNKSQGNGGFAELQDNGSLAIYDSEFTMHAAGFGLAAGIGTHHGGVLFANGTVTVTNSTFSRNTASNGDGGAIYAGKNAVTVRNSTFTLNETSGTGGAISGQGEEEIKILNSIISGNNASQVTELHDQGAGMKVYNSVVGQSYASNADAFDGVDFMTGNFVATGDGGSPLNLIDILDVTLADNGGPGTLPGGANTRTHNLVKGSPAIDIISGEMCDPAMDQRGIARPQGDGCDAGAVEFVAPPLVFVSTFANGTINDLNHGPHDILQWDGEEWTKWFDGTAAGLSTPKAFKLNINAVWISDSNDVDVVMNFAQNGRFIPGITGKVDGMDLVRWNGSSFSLWFDGQDVGLNIKAQEKIDGLHVLPQAPAGSAFAGQNCKAYLLLSSHGPGQVNTNLPAPARLLKFHGEDILGFCATNLGAETTGLWEMVVDGSAMLPKLPTNSVDSISVSADGTKAYVTVRRQMPLNSQVYVYDIASKTVSGPILSLAALGLGSANDALHVNGQIAAVISPP